MSNDSIYSILSSKPHDAHYLRRYVRFIGACCQSNSLKTKEELGYTEDHHICPRSIWPEFDSLKKNQWNKATLTARQHFIAHWMLWKTFKGPLTYAFNSMTNWNASEYEKPNFKHSRTYANLRNEISEKIGKANSVVFYHQPGTTNFIRINKLDTETVIPDGYMKGSGRTHVKIFNETTLEETLISVSKYIDKKTIDIPDGWKIGYPSHTKAMSGSKIWYDPVTLKTQRIAKDKEPPKDWILGSPNTNSITGKTPYYDPITLDTKFFVEGEQPENLIKGTSPSTKEKRKGFTVFKDENGNAFNLHVDDPKIKELNLRGNNFSKEKIKCPHCGKEGFPGGMLRHHFNNCRF